MREGEGVTQTDTERELQHAGDHVLTAEDINKDWLPLPASPTPHTSMYTLTQTTQVVWTIAQITQNKTHFQSKTDQTTWGYERSKSGLPKDYCIHNK
jgi:hypothetical protein